MLWLLTSINFNPWPKTDRPWSRMHIDFAGPLNGFYYLVVVDSYSKWPEILKCKKPIAEVTVKFLPELFSCFGVVDCIVTDNATQFTSCEFKDFCQSFLIEHITTAPYYHIIQEVMDRQSVLSTLLREH